jgi:hypothetical protein
MRINLVMVGEAWSQQDQQKILDKLMKSYTPNLAFEERAVGVSYTYDYVFSSMAEKKANELFALMDAVAVKNDMPEFIAEWMRSEHPELGRPERLEYKMVGAFAVEDWLAKLDRDQGYTLYFLKPPKEKIGYFHTYGMVMKDPDTKRQFIQEGMMGYGGKHRFYFIDLTAGPWFYPYVPTSDGGYIGQFHKHAIYDSEEPEDYLEQLADYINNAVLLLFTPSYLYAPSYKLNHKIDIFLIDMTSGRVFRDVSDKYIDKGTIEQAFGRLVPYVRWSSDIQGHSFDSLPRELQRAILRSLTYKTVQGSDVILVRSSDLIMELNNWVASSLSSEQITAAEKEAEQTVFIPVVLFVFDKEAYVDREAVLGSAVPTPGDESVPCCSVVAVDKHALFDLGTGLSVITIHEMGHVLGLRHPHDGYHPTKGEFVDWFFDWSYTPMTYASPSGLGCGFSQACGLLVTEFGQFNYDAVDRGIVLYLISQAGGNIRKSMVNIEEKGYAKNLPLDLSSKLSSAENDLVQAKSYFADMVYFSHSTFNGTRSIMNPMDDAFDFALRAAITSEELFMESEKLSSNEPKGTNSVILSRPSLVDESGIELETSKLGRPIGVQSYISTNGYDKMDFTYIVKIKDSTGITVFLAWIEGLSASDSEKIDPSVYWIPDEPGRYEAEIFVWKNLNEPIPLSSSSSMRIVVQQ